LKTSVQDFANKQSTSFLMSATRSNQWCSHWFDLESVV